MQSKPEADTREHSLTRVIILHLLPGIFITLFYIAVVPAVQRMHFPPIAALLGSLIVIGITFELGFLIYQGVRKNRRISFKGIVRYRESIPWWQYLLFGTLLFLWTGFVFRFIAGPLDGAVIRGMFRWVPGRFFLSGSANRLNSYSRQVRLATAWVNLVFNGFAGPIVEELYFRGYLLPRMSRLKGWAPLINVLLFSLYHFFTPWQNPVRIIALLPMVYVVWRKRNIYLGIIVHCAGNTFGAVGMFITALGGA